MEASSSALSIISDTSRAPFRSVWQVDLGQHALLLRGGGRAEAGQFVILAVLLDVHRLLDDILAGGSARKGTVRHLVGMSVTDEDVLWLRNRHLVSR